MEKTETLKVGDGATYNVGSDSYPYTIVEISPNGRTVKIQADKAKNKAIYPEQDWEFTPHPEGAVITLTLRSDGAFRPKGQKKGQGVSWGLGYRTKYLNPSF